MKFALRAECVAARLNPDEVEAVAKQLDAVAARAHRMGLTIFGGAGSGSLRINDDPHNPRSRPLVVAALHSGHWDGGDGAWGVPDAAGLMRGE